MEYSWVISDLLPVNGRGNRPTSRLYETAGGQKQSGLSWQIRYGDGSGARGDVYVDQVTIGDLTVEDQYVEAASVMSAQHVRNTASDGLLGLAFGLGNQIRPRRQKTWFENVRPQLKQQLFTASLKRAEVGSYDFGYIDPAKYKGDIAWTPVTGKRAYWDFNATGFSYGTASPIRKASITGIADTGSSLTYLPDAITDGYWKQVQGAAYSQMGGGWTFPCGTNLPDLNIEVAGKALRIDGKNMNYVQQGWTCMGGLQRQLQGLPFALFGDTFLKGLFVVFEAAEGGSARLGFAQGA